MATTTSARAPMDAWMNRYRAFAEGVVVMICPVLLAIALKKVDLKSEEHGRAVPTVMLVVSTVTLVAGICPFLVCCFSKRFLSNGSSGSPHTSTKLLAPLSSTCLVALACWIIYLILNSWAFQVIGALIGLCSVIRTITHFKTAKGEGVAAAAMGCEDECCSRLESSLDFLAGITALLFLGLEGLALEGQNNSLKTIHDRLTKPIGTSFIVCVLGVSLMVVETMPPRKLVRSLIVETIDILTGFAVSLVMFFIMYALMELRALLLLAAPFLILMIYVFYAAISTDDGNGNNSHRSDEESAVSSSSGDSDKPASLELTKVTFTGFLAVSIPSISNGSVSMSTECFLQLAAAAIVSGLIWRLLTHYKSQTTIVSVTADIASFCTHLCVAVAVVPFTIMAGKALS